VAYDIPTLEKQPSESIPFDMEFVGRMNAGETISGVTSFTGSPSGVGALTIATASYSGTKAQARISAGTAGVKYKITVVVTTTAGNTREGEGYLFVRNV